MLCRRILSHQTASDPLHRQKQKLKRLEASVRSNVGLGNITYPSNTVTRDTAYCLNGLARPLAGQIGTNRTIGSYRRVGNVSRVTAASVLFSSVPTTDTSSAADYTPSASPVIVLANTLYTTFSVQPVSDYNRQWWCDTYSQRHTAADGSSVRSLYNSLRCFHDEVRPIALHGVGTPPTVCPDQTLLVICRASTCW